MLHYWPVLWKILTIKFQPLPGLPAELAFPPPADGTCLRDDDSPWGSDLDFDYDYRWDPDYDSSDGSDMGDHFDSDWDVYGEETGEVVEAAPGWEEYLVEFWNGLQL
jgi:hypothetical protein